MAITELVFPTSGTPTVPTDYAYQNGYLAQNAKGYNAVSLTNWDLTTTAPQVASGSAIEINGATWQVDADTSIATTDASSGINYLVFDDDAGAFGWNDTEPTWSAALNGWYVSGDRATGHRITWDGSTGFSAKSSYIDTGGAVSGLFSDKAVVATTSTSTPSVTTHIFPPGQIIMYKYVYAETETYGSAIYVVSIYVGGAWKTLDSITNPGTAGTYDIDLNPFISDGVNFRIVVTAEQESTLTVSYAYRPLRIIG